MRSSILVFFALVATFGLSFAQVSPCTGAQSFHIVVLGSSTAAGTGPTSPDSAWVNRYRRYVQSINPANAVTNLAVGGFTTYRIMPTGYTPPSGRPTPDVTHNITHALSLNPDAILINMPSNDVSSGFTVPEQLFNFDTIIGIAQQAGVPVWITTTQPKNYSNPNSILLQMEVRDSIYARYGFHAIDFWTTIATPGGTIDPLYDSGDGTHLNNAAHGILASRVIGKSILDSLFIPSPGVDAASVALQAINALPCGDSGTLVRLHVANYGLGSGASVPVYLHWQNLSTLQQGTLSDSVSALATCDGDSLDFGLSTVIPGTYKIQAWVAFPGDVDSGNDTLDLLLNSSGQPTLQAVHDTACSFSAFSLAALADPQDTIFWYDQPLGGSPIAAGPAFQTPVLSTTTTYYAEAIRGNLFYTDSLPSTLTTNVNWNGAMVDLIAAASLTLDSFDLKINTLGNQVVGLYTKSGTHVGFQTNSAAWTLHGTANVNVISSSTFTTVPLGGISMNAGDTLGLYFYLQSTASTLSYQSVPQPQTRSNAQVTVVSGSGVSTGFSATFYPRDLKVQPHYHYGSRPEGDCGTARVPVHAVISVPLLTLPPDTIIDVNDTLIIAATGSFAHYQWSTGDSTGSIVLTGTGLGTGIHVITLLATDSLGCTASEEIIVGVAWLLAQAKPVTNSLLLAPQPASNRVQLSCTGMYGPGILKLTSVDGRCLRQWALEGLDIPQTISLDGFSNGIYFIEWQSAEGRAMRKLLIGR